MKLLCNKPLIVKQELTWHFRDNLESEEQTDHLEIQDSG